MSSSEWEDDMVGVERGNDGQEAQAGKVFKSEWDRVRPAALCKQQAVAVLQISFGVRSCKIDHHGQGQPSSDAEGRVEA